MIKTILVPINQESDIDQNLNFAVDMANMFDAHIKMLHVLTPIEAVIGALPMESAYLINAYGDFEKRAEEQAEKYRETCEGKLERAGVRFDWCQETGDLLQCLYTYSRVADVSIIRQEGSDIYDVFDVQNNFIIGGGLPVIAIPDTEVTDHKFGNILVAWDGGRECAKATHDALPFLKMATNVTVVTISEKEKANLPEADICRYLSRHGVNAEALTLSEAVSVERRILDTAESMEADMIVAGAWSHVRMSEIVFGGVTKELLSNQKRPVLLAH